MKQKYKLGTVIAQRELRIQFGETKYEIKILIGKPQLHPPPDLDWFCPFQILGIAGEHISSKIFIGIGFDAIDAIRQATVLAGAFLSSYLRKHPELKRVNPKDLNLPEVTSLSRIRWEEFLRKFRKKNFTVEWKCNSSESESWIQNE
ncbi:DUF6968 family protein [Leptospira kirschneri]|uniref:DUF6968 domain-containing protein n=1 Tax=Leptospira kirschneri str. H1 TaxID=1049966 RepID=A0A0E2B1J7_9LEPT|nr:hypothetical protein [Leptospira kirschneri]EKO15011.1 hypothetical protein LEP1GSC081_1464 [Leptospira kirschneri str. H1]EKO61319.1 hypothetical protein LEP1GSC082_2989 [Leptospira kirschneri str. H2]UML80195.1 hypothetical protein FH602_18320 [Leptospira kirschneri]